MTKYYCSGSAYRFFLLCWCVRISQNNPVFHCGNWFISRNRIIQFCSVYVKFWIILNIRNYSPFHIHIISVLGLFFQKRDECLHGQVIRFLQQNLFVLTLILWHEIDRLLIWTFLKSDYLSTACQQLLISLDCTNNRSNYKNVWREGM